MAPTVYISVTSHHILFVHLPTNDIFQSEVEAAMQIMLGFGITVFLVDSNFLQL